MVLDPGELYELAAELPELERPVLMVAMTGFVDAGRPTKLAADHLRETATRRTWSPSTSTSSTTTAPAGRR